MITKIKDFCDVVKGKIGIMKAIDGKYPLITTKNERRTSNEFHFDAPAVCIPLVSATGHGHASIKTIHHIEGKFALGNILAAIIPKNRNKITSKYLYIYFKGFKDSVLVTLMQGTANVSLKVKDIENIELFIPSLEKQKEVVEHYDSIFDKYSELKISQQKNDKYISKLRQSILSEAVSGKIVPQDPNDEPASVLLEKIKKEKERLIKEKKIRKEKPLPLIVDDEIPYQLPKGWKWVRLGDVILNDIGGGTPSKNKLEYWGGDISWASVKDLNGDKYLKHTIDKITELGLKNSSSNMISKNNIIICTRMGLGKILINQIDVAINQDLRAIFLPENMNQLFFFNYYKTLSFIHSGTTVSGVRREKLLAKLLPLPPLAEQKRIVEKVDALMKLCNQLEAQVKENQKNSEALMNSVLREAFEVNPEKIALSAVE